MSRDPENQNIQDSKPDYSKIPEGTIPEDTVTYAPIDRFEDNTQPEGERQVDMEPLGPKGFVLHELGTPISQQTDRVFFTLAPLYRSAGIPFNLVEQYVADSGTLSYSDLGLMNVYTPTRILDLSDDHSLLQSLPAEQYKKFEEWLSMTVFYSGGSGGSTTIVQGVTHAVSILDPLKVTDSNGRYVWSIIYVVTPEMTTTSSTGSSRTVRVFPVYATNDVIRFKAVTDEVNDNPSNPH